MASAGATGIHSVRDRWWDGRPPQRITYLLERSVLHQPLETLQERTIRAQRIVLFFVQPHESSWLVGVLFSG